jgi:hypothetical protein
MIGIGRIQRNGRGRKMAEALEYEKADEHGNPIKRLLPPAVGPHRKARQVKKQRIDTSGVEASSDEDNHSYRDTEPAESESTSSSESECQYTLPSNAEASFLFLSDFICPHTCRNLL